MSTGTDTEVCAGFKLTGADFDPDEVTRRVGLEPTRTWRAGDIRRPGATAAKISCWSLYTDLEQTWDTDRHIAQVIDLLRPHIQSINAVRKELRLEAEFACVLYIRSKRPALHFDRAILDVVDALDAEIDVDIYVLPEHD